MVGAMKGKQINKHEGDIVKGDLAKTCTENTYLLN
jgi:hypothetical protein